MGAVIKTAQEVQVVPLTTNLGAVVEGVNCKQSPSQAVVKQLKDAILKYKVLFFRQQNLDPEEQSRFARHFGEPFEREGLRFNEQSAAPELTKVTAVTHFHSDYMYLDQQPAFAMLQLLESPPVGGDTMWADLISSYESLSAPMKDMLESLTAEHVHPDYYLDDETIAQRYQQQLGQEMSREDLLKRREASKPREHPVVRVIPETGRKHYWISARHTKSIKELTPEESSTILPLLFHHQLKPEYVIRWKWTVGDIAFWDHRTTLHAGVNDFGKQPRHGRRANIGIASPVPTPNYPNR